MSSVMKIQDGGRRPVLQVQVLLLVIKSPIQDGGRHDVIQDGGFEMADDLSY